MDAELKAKWVKALRSGEYKQGRGYLEKDGSYCCLGVLCAIQDEQWKRRFGVGVSLYTTELPASLNSNLYCYQRRELAGRNDGGQSFEDIADYIEANL